MRHACELLPARKSSVCAEILEPEKRAGELTGGIEELSGQISKLTESQVDELAEALLDFHAPDDLRVWLARAIAS